MSEHKHSVYRNISLDLSEKIRTGVYACGEKLPPERVLMELYGVERTTVRRALELLCADGVIVKRSGLGSFVRAKDEPLTERTAEEGGTQQVTGCKKPTVHVRPDIWKGAESLIRTLTGFGHERIAYIGSDPQMFAALGAALAAVGLYQSAYHVFVPHAEDCGLSFERFWHALRLPSPTALVTDSTASASLLETRLRRLGLQAPTDITLAALSAESGGRYGGCVYERPSFSGLYVSENASVKPFTVLALPRVYEGETVGEKSRARAKNMSDYLL